MILFCGIPSEPPLALAIGAAERVGVDFEVLHQRDFGDADLMVEITDGCVSGKLWTAGREHALEDFTGVYTRLMEHAAVPPRFTPSFDRFRNARCAVFDQLLNDWMEIAECRVLNRARAMSSNISKPYQLQLIAPFFSTPSTLVTNDPQTALAFIEERGEVIYKSTSAVRSIVKKFSANNAERLWRLRNLPTQFQGWIAGSDIRVHVIGRKLFASIITSSAVDYRYAQRDGLETRMEAVQLPQTIEARCFALSERLQLPFCGIDLRLTPGGEYYCFEVNPAPAYSYFEEQTGQPIAEALVQYLAGEEE